MRILLIVVATLMLGACRSPSYDREPWQTAPAEHNCTAEQMERVKVETYFCNDNTSYYSPYCYGTAIMRNCTLREKPKCETPTRHVRYDPLKEKFIKVE